jgi:hypothetical protein
MKPSYLIYNNISKDEFLDLFQRIKSIEKEVDQICNENGFFQHTPNNYEVLGLDYIFDDGIFMGNLGFNFNDDSIHSFCFYISKSFDEKDQRKFKNETLQNLSLDEIVINIKTLFFDAVKLFNKWKKEDLGQVSTFTDL